MSIRSLMEEIFANAFKALEFSNPTTSLFLSNVIERLKVLRNRFDEPPPFIQVGDFKFHILGRRTLQCIRTVHKVDLIGGRVPIFDTQPAPNLFGQQSTLEEILQFDKSVLGFVIAVPFIYGRRELPMLGGTVQLTVDGRADVPPFHVRDIFLSEPDDAPYWQAMNLLVPSHRVTLLVPSHRVTLEWRNPVDSLSLESFEVSAGVIGYIFGDRSHSVVGTDTDSSSHLV